MMAKLSVGDTAPAFTLPDEEGRDVSLSDYAGRSVVVYFYPADDTPGCTKEACQFSDLLPDFSKVNADVLGISPNSAASHQKFRAKYDLKLHLLVDADKSVMASYGAYGEKMMYGKKTVGVIRSTFLVGPDGTLAAVWYNVRADGHAAKVLEALGA
jgi:peroxiredoxin Q/BCP